MSQLDAVDLLKNNQQSNDEEWLKETEIVSYGVVTQVISSSLVQVQQIVRLGLSKKFMTVPLLSTGSSLLEESAEPVVGDLVLLLFLDRYSRNMFDSPVPRHDVNGDWGLKDEKAVGYNKFSGVGILLAPARGFAETVVRHYLDGGDPAVMFRSRAKWDMIFAREMTVLFDALPSGDGLIDRLVQMTFGQHSPHLVEHWAKVTRRYGFAVLPDLSLETVDAAVLEEYSEMAPITKNIQGTQDITVGKGTDPAGDPDGSEVDTHAPVNITLGADAEINIVSESGLIMTFEGPITIHSADTVEIMAGTAKLIKIGNSINTLGPLIDSLVNALQTAPLVAVTGAAGLPSPINPTIAAALVTFKGQWDQVFN